LASPRPYSSLEYSTATLAASDRAVAASATALAESLLAMRYIQSPRRDTSGLVAVVATTGSPCPPVPSPP